MTDPTSSTTDVPPLAAPGSPAEPDEFAHVPTPRRRPPWLAIFVVAFAAYLVFHQRHDVSFALSSSSPRDAGDARALAADLPNAPTNRYVRVHGSPDFESALLFDTQGSWVFNPFFRLLGTDGRVFVHRLPDPLPVREAESNAFVGRLVRLRDLPYDDSIRRYFAAHVSVTRAFDPKVLHDALAAKSNDLTLADRTGERVTLGGSDVLVIERIVPDALDLVLPKQRFPKPEDARAAFARTGAEVLTLDTTPGEEGRHLARVRAPADRRAAVVSALADLDTRLQIRPARDTLTAKIVDVAAKDGAFAVRSGDAAPTSIPTDEVASVRLTAAAAMPPDAVILLEGDRPRDHLRSVFVSAFFVGFALLNLLALRKAA